MDINERIARLEGMASQIKCSPIGESILSKEAYEKTELCSCCSKPILLPSFVGKGSPFRKMDTCIPCSQKHWSKHARGINASRCHEFGNREQLEGRA